MTTFKTRSPVRGFSHQVAGLRGTESALGPLILAAAWLVTGCASTDVNPPSPKANTGYVDLYTQTPDDLHWDVQSYESAAKEFKTVFSELNPVESGVLRLALPPGRHKLRIAFLNRVIAQPGEVEVEVAAGKITPICVTLTKAGTSIVPSKETSYGSTSFGRYGRRTKFDTDVSVTYNISALPDAPVAYEVKGKMPYARQN